MRNSNKLLSTLFGIALAGLATAAVGAEFDAEAFKAAGVKRTKSYISVTNGILSVQYDTSSGRFTINTGANHPQPNQTVLYPVGTSYITLRDATSSETFVNCQAISSGLSGYTGATMCPTPPQITALTTGFRATFTLPNWTVVQEVKVNGTTLSDTNVSQAVTVTNTTRTPREYGVRYMWDWMIAGNDAAVFRQRNPDGNYTSTFANFPNPTFQLFEEVNNPQSPIFSIYATVGGGALIPSPTTPDHLRYARWGSAYSSAWEFSNTGGGGDSGTTHYWGYDSPLRLNGGRSATFLTYITTQFSAVTPPSAQVTLSSNALNFGDVGIGSSSAPQTVSITSGSEVPYQISGFDSTAMCQAGGMCVGGGFVCSTTCSTAPTSYAAGTSCQVSASFAPTATGPQTTTVYICDNATGSPHAITLTGNGVAAPQIVFSPSSHDFGSLLAGTRGAPQSFTVFNPGASPVTISSVTTTGDFVLSSTTCGATLAAGDRCTASVLFAPTQSGRANGTLVVATSSGSSRVALSGTGFQEARVQAPSSVEFGAYTIGSTPLSQTVTLTSAGNAVLSLSSISVTEPFTLTNACPLNLAPGETCNLLLGFGPNRAGDFTGMLTIVSNAGGGITTVALTANAQPVPVPAVRISPVSIGFGDRLIGTMGPTQRITVTNEGGAPAVITSINSSIDFPIVSRTCGATLLPQGQCFVDVAMKPTKIGRLSGQLLVNTNSAGSPHTIELRGTGCFPFIAGGNRFVGRPSCGI